MPKLTPREKLFIAEYPIDLNGAHAAIRAGYSPKSAKYMARQLMEKREIRDGIAKVEAERIKRITRTGDDILRSLMEIEGADARELSEFRRTCCRYCWSRDHLYHWTPAEFDAASKKIEERNFGRRGKHLPLPSCDGGLDFDRTRDPNGKCPECRGEGVGHTFFHDTRRFSRTAARLFGGVKVGKDGIEFLMSSQEKARELLGKHFALFKEQVELTGKDGGPIEVDTTRERIARKLAGLTASSDTPGDPS